MTPYRYLIPFMWLVWAAYWWVAAYRAKSTDRREPLGSRLLHVLPLALSGWLLSSANAPGAKKLRAIINGDTPVSLTVVHPHAAGIDVVPYPLLIAAAVTLAAAGEPLADRVAFLEHPA